MSRLPARDDVIYVKPRNNMYTAIAASGVIAMLIGLLALWSQMSALGFSK